VVEAAVATRHQTQAALAELEAQASSFLNMPTRLPSPTQAVDSPIQPQLLADLLSQHLLPEPAMFLGVKKWPQPFQT
jgi:hypothetical protein